MRSPVLEEQQLAWRDEPRIAANSTLNNVVNLTEHMIVVASSTGLPSNRRHAEGDRGATCCKYDMTCQAAAELAGEQLPLDGVASTDEIRADAAGAAGTRHAAHGRRQAALGSREAASAD